MRDLLPDDWAAVLGPAMGAPSFSELTTFVTAERAAGDVYPAESDLFRAFRLTPLDGVWAVILGQDPYHGTGQAHGLAFSVPDGVRHPPSLANILREWSEDLGRPRPASGSLEPWARNGVLLLNTALTVRRDAPGSHRDRGWEPFTDAVIDVLAARDRPTAFLLWGKAAQAKRERIGHRHVIVEAAHPSPLAIRGFRGTRPFSTTNARLAEAGVEPIDWGLEPAVVR
jgi:uracil-DNA glycosylase